MDCLHNITAVDSILLIELNIRMNKMKIAEMQEGNSHTPK